MAHDHDHHAHSDGVSRQRLIFAAAVNVTFAPTGVEPDVVRDVLRTHRSGTDVHHVHSRSIGPGTSNITAHVVIDGALRVHDAQRELDDIQALLRDRLRVDHATAQIEYHEWDDAAHPA